MLNELTDDQKRDQRAWRLLMSALEDRFGEVRVDTQGNVYAELLDEPGWVHLHAVGVVDKVP